MREYKLNWEAALRITQSVLLVDEETLQEGIKSGKAHPDDMKRWKKIVKAIKVLKTYYGC